MGVLNPDRPWGGYGNILLPRGLSLPLDLEALSGGRERAELEIGFGNGEYTVRYAASHPDTFFVGMEVSPACILRCARRSAGLDNLRLVRTDARYMMKELFADASLDRVAMNFPCPWPKKRHAHRRVTARDFTDDLAAVLKRGGVFELVTDDEPYAQEVQARLSAHAALELRSHETNPERPVTTKYERKWMEQGKTIHRLTFVKTRDFTVVRRTWRDAEMHIRTEYPLKEERLSALDGTSGRQGDARWAFGRHYIGTGARPCFLVDTFSTDDEFEQRYYLRVSERDGGTLIQLDGTANAFLTPAVRCAAEDLARRLSPSGDAALS